MGSKVWQQFGLALLVFGGSWSAGTLIARAGSTPVNIPTLDSTGTNAGVNSRGFGADRSLQFGKYGFSTGDATKLLVQLQEGETLTLNQPDAVKGWQVTRSSNEPGGFRVDVGQQNAIALQSIFQSLSPDAKTTLGLTDQAPVLNTLPADVKAALSSFRLALESGTPNGTEIGTGLNNLLVVYGRFASGLKEPLSPELQAFQNELARLRRRINFGR